MKTYMITETASGHAVCRGDGTYAEFLTLDEAIDAKNALSSGEDAENDYEWTDHSHPQWHPAETVYVVRDAAREYLRADGSRTPASDEAREFETEAEARAACDRATDKVLAREID